LIDNLAKFSLFFLISFSLVTTVLAQEQDLFILDRKAGLNSNSITAISQDVYGYSWIATKNGLHRYDGSTIKTYGREGTGFGSVDFTDILTTHSGDIFVATANGELYRYDDLKDKFRRINIVKPGTEKPSAILSLYETSNGQLLLGTNSGMIVYSLSGVPVDVIGPQYRVQQISESDDGTLWIATLGHGLLKWRNNVLTPVISDSYELPKYVSTLSLLDQETLLLGTVGDGLYACHIDVNSLLKLSDAIFTPTITVKDIVRRKGQTYLVATEGHGLFELLGDGQEYFDLAQVEVVGDKSISTIYVDKDENVWLGMAWEGVKIIADDDTPFELTQYEDEAILSIYGETGVEIIGTDGKGLWTIGTDGRLDKKQLPGGAEYINFIQPISSSRFWLGTFQNGLIELNTQEGVKRHFSKHNELGLTYNDVRGVVEMPNGDIYIATWGGGLNYYISDTDTLYALQGSTFGEGIAATNIVDIVYDQSGRLYLATFGDGLLYLDIDTGIGGRIPLKDDTALQQYANLFTLHLTSSGQLWVGTWDDGLLLYDTQDNHVQTFEHAAMFGRRSIKSIIDDGHGAIWLATENGLIKYQTELGDFQLFASMPTDFRKGAVFKDLTGRLHYGCSDGILSFDPTQIKQKTDSLKLVITDFALFDKPISAIDHLLKLPLNATDHLNLSYKQTMVTIGYSALQYPSNDPIQYRIRLAGLDESWREVGKQRSVTYTNLAPGYYEFQVDAYSDGLVVGSKSISFDVATPPWLTWWAYTIYALLVLLTLSGIVYLSVQWGKMKTNLKLEKITHEKDRELFETKQRFFNHISHEIRTPVTIILSAIKHLVLEPESVKYFDQDNLKTIRRSGRNLLQLINELLDYSKLDAGKVKLDYREISLKGFVEDIYRSFSVKAKDLGVVFKIDFQSDQETIGADAYQLQKAVYNLLSNGLKHAGSEGQLMLKISSDDQHVFFAVADSGPGIPEELQDKVFDPFFQIKSETSFGGFGIGLSVVKDIVRLHEGEVSVRSGQDQDGGAVFTIKLPLFAFGLSPSTTDLSKGDETVPSAPLEVLSEDKDPLVGTTILIIEDNTEIREVLKSIFKGYHLLEAADGQEGHRIASSEIPDIIVSDVLMPGMTGIELVQTLKKEVTTCHIPMILLTARTGVVFKKEGFDVGADDYISKPFNDQILLARVRNLINSRRALWKKFKLDTYVDPGEVKNENQDDHFIKHLKDVISDNLQSGEINSEFLAKEMGMSHSVIYKKLKQLTGMTLVEFVREYKLKIAAALLKKNKYTVQDACHHAGFADRRYFSRAFKAKYGKTPSEYSQAGSEIATKDQELDLDTILKK